jgi:hypothetical protein
MLTMKASAPNCLQLLRREVGQHHADQEAHQRRDGQRRGADAVQVARHIAPRAVVRRARQAAHVDHQLASQAHKAAHMAPGQHHTRRPALR